MWDVVVQGDEGVPGVEEEVCVDPHAHTLVGGRDRGYECVAGRRRD